MLWPEPFAFIMPCLIICLTWHSTSALAEDPIGTWNGTFESTSGYVGTIKDWTIQDGASSGFWAVEGGPVDLGNPSGACTLSGEQLQFSMAAMARGFDSTSTYRLTGTGTIDIAPAPDGDGIVNLLDFAVLVEHLHKSGIGAGFRRNCEAGRCIVER